MSGRGRRLIRRMGAAEGGIESGNKLPLIMEAHRRLSGLVRLSRCREIDVDVMNRDRLR